MGSKQSVTSKVSLASAVFTLLCWTGVGSAQTYIITELGTLGGTFSSANGINNNGQVVGGATTSDFGDTHAFLWSNGTMSDLGTLGGTASSATDINDNGQVVGSASTNGGAATRAFLWSNGSMSDLGTLGGTQSYGLGINDSGQIAGGANISGNARVDAFRWTAGSMQDLGTANGTQSHGYDINNSGQVVGTAHNNLGVGAILWSGENFTDLGTLGGTNSAPFGINNTGQVVGYSFTSNGEQHPFLWSSGSMSDLGTLSGTSSYGSHASAINNNGQIVGSSKNRAFLHSGGTMLDLNTLIPSDSGWNLAKGNAINNVGQIVGEGTHNGKSRGFLLTPVGAAATYVPEPEVITRYPLPPVAGKEVPRLARWDNATETWKAVTEGSINSSNVRVLVHGWGKNQAGWVNDRRAANLPVTVWDDTSFYSDWTALAKSIATQGDPTASILAFSWIDFSATDDSLTSANLSRAATDGTGKLMSRYLQQALDPSFSGEVALFGHSHGARVATIAAKQLRTDHINVDQLTIADSPEKWYTDGVPGLPANGRNNLTDVLRTMDLGRSADKLFVDNYISALGKVLRNADDNSLKNIVDVFLKPLPEGLGTEHGYPYRWFTRMNDDEVPGVALAWSPALGADNQALASKYTQDEWWGVENGTPYVDHAREGILTANGSRGASQSDDVPSLEAPETDVTTRMMPLATLLRSGTVQEGGDFVTLVEGSNTALWHGKLTTASGDDTFTFDYQFSNPGDGDSLALWIDDEMQFIMTGVLAGTDMQSSTINLADLIPGDHILSIGLYGYGQQQAAVSVNNLVITSVPEPSLAAVAIGILSFPWLSHPTKPLYRGVTNAVRIDRRAVSVIRCRH